jgi:DNA-binding LacI/PurR family transcriptional regulator
MGRITQKDIAKLAGVCQPIVSQVLSGRGATNIRSSTSERILQIARELDYSPKSAEKSELTQTNTIGFLVPGRMTTQKLMIYTNELYDGVCGQLDEYGYHLNQAIIRQTDTIPDIILQKMADGVVIVDECNADLIRRIQQLIPVVLLNYMLEYDDIDSVMPDNIGGIWRAMQHLYQLGHRRIGIFGLEPTWLHSAERIQGYHRCIKQLALPFTEDYVAVRQPVCAGDEVEVEEYARETLIHWRQLAEPPTAALSLSDIFASFMLRAARDLGITVPDQFSIVGFDNLPLCVHTQPRLTSIEQRMAMMGRSACTLLINRIAAQDQPIAKLRLGVNLVERESTAPPPGV